MTIFLWILLVVILVALGPLATIWALNDLFGLELAYTFHHWLAVLWLGAVITSGRNGSKS